MSWPLDVANWDGLRLTQRFRYHHVAVTYHIVSMLTPSSETFVLNATNNARHQLAHLHFFLTPQSVDVIGVPERLLRRSRKQQPSRLCMSTHFRENAKTHLVSIRTPGEGFTGENACVRETPLAKALQIHRKIQNVPAPVLLTMVKFAPSGASIAQRFLRLVYCNEEYVLS